LAQTQQAVGQGTRLSFRVNALLTLYLQNSRNRSRFGEGTHMKLKLTPAVVVEVGALICVSGVLLLVRLELSEHELLLVRTLAVILIGLLFIQIGYAQSLRERVVDDLKKRPPAAHNPSTEE
jgi:peptidoglycan biosynthesis protein MviN/MurJ (putative lipid II flippase)